MATEAAENVRPAELRGAWYPRSATACDEFLDRAIQAPQHHATTKTEVKAKAKEETESPTRTIGAIVPHAGWVYSGGVAFRTLRALADRSESPEILFVFGGHLGPRDPVRIMIEGGWETPYGPAMVERDIAEDLSMAVEGDPETPDHYYEDNAIEVLMPMLKKLWPSAKVVTVGVPPTSIATRIGAEAIDRARARGVSRMLVIGSTDLTHYGPNYRFSPRGVGRSGLEWVKTTNDAAMIERLVGLDASQVIREAERSRNACCPGAIAATMAAARKLGATEGEVVEYTTSFDVQPNGDEPSSFVGYVGVLLDLGVQDRRRAD